VRDGEPILGMQKYLDNSTGNNKSLLALMQKQVKLVLAPNNEPEGSQRHSTARSHGDFDNDLATVRASLARILRLETIEANIDFVPSASSLTKKRHQLG